MEIADLILSSLLGSWPADMKFRPAGILTLVYVDPKSFIRHIPLFFERKTSRIISFDIFPFLIMYRAHISGETVNPL